MSNRLQKTIDREKIKYPNKNIFSLLMNRTTQILLEKFKNIKMVLIKDSTFSSEEEILMCSLFPRNVLNVVITQLKPTSVLDIGCGVGKSLEYLSNFAIETVGVENSEVAISKSSMKHKIIKHNLKYELNLNRSFDLVWCFEVIEHIHPQYEEVFLSTLANHSNNILISAAKPGQGGHGHFNEQEPGYWIKKFKTLGYNYNEEFSAKVKSTNDSYSQNLMFFEKA